MKKSIIAFGKFPSFNCAQSVFASFAEDLKIDEETALKISSGFGGGMANAETCGAVTGSYMVLGMKYGFVHNDPEAKAFTKSKIQKFNELFIAEYGSLICKELIHTDISTEQGLEMAKNCDVFNKLCPHFIQSACTILEEQL